MCELLVRTADVSHPDPVSDAGCEKRGDVVTACPDGWGWSEAERSHIDWRIVAVPGLGVSAAGVFLAPGRTAPGSGGLATRRAFRIDLDLDVDGTEGGGGDPGPLVLTPGELELRRRTVAPVDDPRFIGEARNIIG